MSGFDETRAPSLDLIEDCVHCGFCLPTCPTYVLWDEEMDSPRGRIVLMRAAHGEAELSEAMVQHWDRCLGCMACVTACPSGVQYDKLIEDTRAQVERRFPRPARERLARRAAFALFPRPGRLRALAPALAAVRALRLDRLAARAGVAAAALTPRTPLRSALRRLPERFPARGEVRGRVALLQGCVQRVFFGDVNLAAARCLAAEGFEVDAPSRPGCCGALQLHAGDDEPARARARETISALQGYDRVAVTAAGCGSAMRDYPHLLRDDPVWRERAEVFAAHVRDVTELLAEAEPRAPRRPVELKAAYHDPCHLAHAQGVREAPRTLLRAIPGVELLEPAEWELCCGSAGIYNLLQPEAATKLGKRKARNLRVTGADAVVAANPGCALQIAAHADLPVLHPVEVIWRSISGD